ncbi:integral membrane domain protein [Mycobacterium kansasii]|uniref:Integral membrane domain protein n=1 Tax=Mycobacterium kansasii TaxID=1768 RepID=A0A1V3XAF1_MYCKA|nr:integral membrane domain protein [Mycobacterium kansasii]
MTAAIAGLVLVVAAFMVPRMHLDGVIPLINSTPAQIRAFAQAAPIFGWWNAHIGWGTVPAVLIALAAVLWDRPWPRGCRGERCP